MTVSSMARSELPPPLPLTRYSKDARRLLYLAAAKLGLEHDSGFPPQPPSRRHTSQTRRLFAVLADALLSGDGGSGWPREFCVQWREAGSAVARGGKLVQEVLPALLRSCPHGRRAATPGGPVTFAVDDHEEVVKWLRDRGVYVSPPDSDTLSLGWHAPASLAYCPTSQLICFVCAGHCDAATDGTGCAAEAATDGETSRCCGGTAAGLAAKALAPPLGVPPSVPARGCPAGSRPQRQD